MSLDLAFYADEKLSQKLNSTDINFGKVDAGTLGRKVIYVRNENVFPAELVIGSANKDLQIYYPLRLEPGQTGKIEFSYNAPLKKREPLDTKWSMETIWMPRGSDDQI